MLTIVEKVLILQDVDIFKHTLTENLAYIAMITKEFEIEKGKILFKENDIPNSMYVVISGKVRLERGSQVEIAGPRHAISTWSLFDDEPQVFTALIEEKSRLLKIEKEDLFDLLDDHGQITRGILETITKKLRKQLRNLIGSRFTPRIENPSKSE